MIAGASRHALFDQDYGLSDSWILLLIILLVLTPALILVTEKLILLIVSMITMSGR